MNVFKRAVKLIFGILLIVIAICLGILSMDNPAFVVWFGISCAFLAPISIIVIGSVMKKESGSGHGEALNKLLKIKEIDELIRQAETEEEKIRLLQQERNQLKKVVQFEMRKSFLFERKNELINNAKIILENLSINERELEKLNLDKKDECAKNPEVDELYMKIEGYVKQEETRQKDKSGQVILAYKFPFLTVEISSPIINKIFAPLNNFLKW